MAIESDKTLSDQTHQVRVRYQNIGDVLCLHNQEIIPIYKFIVRIDEAGDGSLKLQTRKGFSSGDLHSQFSRLFR
jgi:hypothetical protein